MVGAVARGAALVLPWLAVLAVSASIASGMTAAVTGGEVAGPRQIVTTVVDRPADSEACDTTSWTLYVGLNTWIPAPRSVAPCAEGTMEGD